MLKFHFIFDKTKKAEKLKKKYIRIYKNHSPRNADHIIVAGGDGFMLSTLKRFSKYNKSFYGINCGTFGFLMNNHVENNLEKKIKRANKITINPLELQATTLGGDKKKQIAINEVSLFRQSRQTASLQLIVGKKIIIKKLISDGILISTPAGSTAYNLSVHGPILSLNSGKLAITPISPFRPRRWKGKIISSLSKVKVKNLDFNKRPVAAVADNIEIRNIKFLSIKKNKKIKINLLFDKNRSLVKRIKIEQLRKNIN
jgi:NAD+ kinase